MLRAKRHSPAPLPRCCPVSFVNKSAVLRQILSQLRAEFDLQSQAAHHSRDEAISEESRPENQYDMHSQEAAYLAEGQARLAADISESIKRYEVLQPLPHTPGAPIAVGTLVALEDSAQRRSWYFLGPRGGMDIKVDGDDVLVLSPQAPFGRELLGKEAGDEVRLPGKSGGIARVIELR